VKSLLDKELGGGRYGVSWDGRGAAGEPVGAGVYLVRMKAGSFTEVRKLVFLR
jgi:hypothetical protein